MDDRRQRPPGYRRLARAELLEMELQESIDLEDQNPFGWVVATSDRSNLTLRHLCCCSGLVAHRIDSERCQAKDEASILVVSWETSLERRLHWNRCLQSWPSQDHRDTGQFCCVNGRRKLLLSSRGYVHLPKILGRVAQVCSRCFLWTAIAATPV